MKYKYNNEWVDVNIKALDSMPVGTQVEYTGTDIPNGWEQINDYSTTEIDTGKRWIDGKPIYRKCVSTTTGNTNVDKSIMSISNVDNIISISGTVSNSVGGIVQLNYTFGTHWGAMYFQTDTLYCVVTNAAYAGQPILAIVEYTKTTD